MKCTWPLQKGPEIESVCTVRLNDQRRPTKIQNQKSVFLKNQSDHFRNDIKAYLSDLIQRLINASSKKCWINFRIDQNFDYNYRWEQINILMRQLNLEPLSSLYMHIISLGKQYNLSLDIMYAASSIFPVCSQQKLASYSVFCFYSSKRDRDWIDIKIFLPLLSTIKWLQFFL